MKQRIGQPATPSLHVGVDDDALGLPVGDVQDDVGRLARDAAETMWLHELGHFLNRYGEMYGEAGCVHVAAEGLGYFKWHRAIRKADNKCSAPPAVVTKF